mmetsp:Transcript_12831/g.35452  ORF Transcript_12831/g.35452 Transcript_12831/m.35452 type:complete len:92 (-) Transcript_12831:1175-1450(-)
MSRQLASRPMDWNYPVWRSWTAAGWITVAGYSNSLVGESSSKLQRHLAPAVLHEPMGYEVLRARRDVQIEAVGPTESLRKELLLTWQTTEV